MTIRITNRLFGTQAIATHCPGPLHPSWHLFSQAVMSQPRRQCACPDVTILTWHSGTRPEKPCGVLERSLDLLGVRTLVLGQGIRDWKNIRKFEVTAAALRNIHTPYVIGADSCDVMFVDDPNLAVRWFQRHATSDLMFNATGSRCWPELPEFVRFESSLPGVRASQGRHWLNSGLFIGKTEFCREYFRSLSRERPIDGYEGSDQAVIKQSWPRWYPRVQLDYECSMFQWFNEDRKVMVLERPVAPRHHELLRVLRQLPGPILGAEIGVFDGHTSETLLRELPGLRLWMIDPWKVYDGPTVFSKMEQASFDVARRHAIWWTEFAADRRFIMPAGSLDAARRFGDATLDFAFIDGNHVYEHVRDDLEAWWPKIRPGGWFLGHDYGVYGDATGLWGVRRAVDEFANLHRVAVHVGTDGVWSIPR